MKDNVLLFIMLFCAFFIWVFTYLNYISEDYTKDDSIDYTVMEIDLPDELISYENNLIFNWESDIYEYWIDSDLFDFDYNTYIFISMWERNTWWYSISIDNISYYNDEVIFDVIYEKPWDSCIVTQAITYPNKLIKLDKIERNISFSIDEEITDC